MSPALATAHAIARTLHAARGAGERPSAIVIGPAVLSELVAADIGHWSAGPGQYSLLFVPVEIDASEEGWRVRTAPRGRAADGP